MERDLILQEQKNIFETYEEDVIARFLKVGQKQDEQCKGRFIKAMSNIFYKKLTVKKANKDYNDLDNFFEHIATKLSEVKSNILYHEASQQHYTKILVQRKSNIEIQLRFKQGFVEIPDNQAVPALDDAILITRAKVKEQNDAIKANGQAKVEAMNKIKEVTYQKAKA